MIVYDNKTAKEKEQEIIHRQASERLEKPRHVQEISARYRKDLADYLALSRADKDDRDTRMMLYAEIKALGWCLGRAEKKTIRDIQLGREV